MASHDPVRDAREDAALARVRLRVAAGAPSGSDAHLPPGVHPALEVADRVGAPVLPTLDAAVDAHRHRRRLAQQVRTATAPTRTVAGGLVLLPVVAVPALAGLLGIDLGGFYTTPLGAVVGAVAGGLWIAGAAMIGVLVARAGGEPATPNATGRVLVAALVGWLVVAPWVGVVAAVVARMTFRAPPAPPHPRLADAADLVATALSAGLTVPAALREVAPAVPDLAPDLRRLAWQVELGRLTVHADRPGAPDVSVPPPCRPLAATLADGLHAGGPLVPALRALATQLRDERGAAAEAGALRLPARLTFPTALCLLPATVLAIGAPIVVTGLSAVSGT